MPLFGFHGCFWLWQACHLISFALSCSCQQFICCSCCSSLLQWRGCLAMDVPLTSLARGLFIWLEVLCLQELKHDVGMSFRCHHLLSSLSQQWALILQVPLLFLELPSCNLQELSTLKRVLKMLFLTKTFALSKVLKPWPWAFFAILHLTKCQMRFKRWLKSLFKKLSSLLMYVI